MKALKQLNAMKNLGSSLDQSIPGLTEKVEQFIEELKLQTEILKEIKECLK